MHNIPTEYLDTPVYLKTVHSQQYLQFDGSCSTDVKSLMILSRSSGWGNVMCIQSASQQGCSLRVQDCDSGQCTFLDNGFELSTQFRVETAADATEGVTLYFISCATGNVLQCLVQGESSFAYCCDLNREPWKAWMIVLPEEVDSKPSATAATKHIAEVDDVEDDQSLESREEAKLEGVDSKPPATKEVDTKLQAMEETVPLIEVEAAEVPDEAERAHSSAEENGNWSIPEGPWRVAAGFALGVAAMPVLGMAAHAAAVPLAMTTVGSVVARVGIVAGAMALVPGENKVENKGEGTEEEEEENDEIIDGIATDESASTNLVSPARSTFGSVVSRVESIAGSFSLVPGAETEEESATNEGTETDNAADTTGPVPWTMPTFGSVISRVGTMSGVFSLMEELDAAATAEEEIHPGTETDTMVNANESEETIDFTSEDSADDAEEAEVTHDPIVFVADPARQPQ
jgi:hypothetical protein